MSIHNHKLKGVFTALITPFKNGQVDFNSLANLVRFQLENGIDGFVVNGTTAESPTLTNSEVEEIYKFVRKNTPKEKAIILGTGSNCTRTTVEKSMLAENWGADAVLVVVPYYNKPTQAGLVQHFNKVANSIKIPTILYNVPGRTITKLELQTIVELSENKNIIGIKEATGDLEFDLAIQKKCHPEFISLSGDDATYSHFMRQGGHGVISVSSHIIPKAMKAIDTEKYSKLIDLLFVEPNPTPVKKALNLMGIIQSDECRLPLVKMTDQNAQILKSEMQKVGILA
jgi:4-hydroxy-tetrahydrodipicolinate synthase